MLPPGKGAAAAVPADTAHGSVRKTVYFVRHGRGQHNQAADELGDAVYEDEAYFDSELVEEGLAQAAQARQSHLIPIKTAGKQHLDSRCVLLSIRPRQVPYHLVGS